MKKNLLNGVVIAAVMSLGMTSCGDDSSSIGAGMGRISPEVAVDPEVVTANNPTASRAGEDDAIPSVSDLKLKLTSEDGTYSREWNSVDEFDPSQDFKTGNYTLEAYYGSADDAEGEGKPYFYGKQNLEVKYDRVTTVALSAKMENSRVKIAYTDAFRDYMTSYTAQLHTPQGNYIDVPATMTAPVYVTTGTVNVNLTFTKPNGTTATIEAARFTAKAKTEHVVTFDVNNGDAGADAILKVTFDDTVDAENVEIDLSDDILNAPAPVITGEGFTDGQNFDIVEGGKPASPVKLNVNARGRIASVMLTTDSRALAEAGWPADLDLCTVDEAMIARLQNLGLSARGIWRNPDMLGFIDFTGVFSHLQVAAGMEESVNKFTVQVKDRYGKLSEVLSFTVTVDKGEVSITSASSLIGSKTLDAVVEYNGDNFADEVKFQIRDDLGLGTWNDLKIVSASAVRSRSVPCRTYNVKLQSTTPMQQEMTIRAVYRDIKPEATVTLTMPEFSVSAESADIFATRADVTLACAQADPATVAKFVTEATFDNAAAHVTADGATLHMTGLKPGTTGTLTLKASNRTASTQLTTEAATQLPNSDMETWFRQNGKTQYWWVDFPGADANAVWGTMNQLTTSEGGDKTNAFNHSGTSYCAFSGTRPTGSGFENRDIANGSKNTERAHTGQYAAVISTVGWGSGNSAWLGSTGSSACDNITVGELYLGKYNSQNKRPDYTGIDFASRPSALSFYYYYCVKNKLDYGYAEVTVMDASGNVLASGEKNLAAAADYTQTTIPLTYAAGAAKAAKIVVKFKSSNNPACQTISDDNLSCPKSTNLSNGRYTGSELFVDDITLNY